MRACRSTTWTSLRCRRGRAPLPVSGSACQRVKGLAFARNLPCAGVSTLAAMARGIEGMPFEGIVLAAMDARCAQIYTASFACEKGRISRLTPDEALTIEEVGGRLQNLPEFAKKSIFIVGDGAEICYNALRDKVPGLILAPETLRYQQAAGWLWKRPWSLGKAALSRRTGLCRGICGCPRPNGSCGPGGKLPLSKGTELCSIDVKIGRFRHVKQSVHRRPSAHPAQGDPAAGQEHGVQGVPGADSGDHPADVL